VGHPKTGTSSLYHMLRAHPQIFMPDMKEPTFFATELKEDRNPWTLETYLELFAPARSDQLVGEASSLYLLSPVAIEHIAQLSSEARVIAMFREPAEWLRSLHAQLLKNHVESELDLRAAIALQSQRREGKVEVLPAAANRLHLLNYTGNVFYADHLARLRRVMGRNHVHVVIHDDLLGNNAMVLRDLCEFLGVDDSVELPRVVTNVTERSMRFQRVDRSLQAFAHGTGGYRFAKAPIKALMSERIRRRAMQQLRRHVIFGPVPPVDWELDHELRAMFKPEVERFGEMIGRDLVALWGYGDLSRTA
jgi:hypothetical protein